MQNPSNWNVIVVDDEPDNLGVLKLVLEYHDAEVRIAETAEMSLKLLQEQCPTFMLIDIQMPDMSGFELLTTIRQKHGLDSLPLIAVTAHSMSGDAERILDAGFNGYMSKPINALSLIDELRQILQDNA